tara:strand:- start:412 stop:588 length:177 start_codon:yes stop_codon:yes gene_type:complete
MIDWNKLVVWTFFIFVAFLLGYAFVSVFGDKIFILLITVLAGIFAWESAMAVGDKRKK